MKTQVVLHQNYIKVHYQQHCERIRISTGIGVNDKKHFGNGKLRSIVDDYVNKQLIINKKQQDIETIITDFLFEQKHYPSISELKPLLIKQPVLILDHEIDNPVQSSHILTHFQAFLKAKESDFSIRNRRPESIKDYRNVFFYIQDYEKYLKRLIKLEDVNKIWLNGFVKFLETPREGRRYFSKGNLVGKTIKKRIVMLISFFRWLDQEEIFPFPRNIRGYSKNIEDSPTVKTTFNKEEVKKIYAFQTPIKQHEFVRDVFIFSCMTGLRWSDLISLNKTHLKQIDGIGYVVEKETIKTSERVIVPLNSIALEIFNKWCFNFNYYSNATFNKALKTFLHRTGYFEAETEFLNPNGGFKKVYEIISIHRGRDIFITSLLNSRVPIPEVMKYTGHKSMTTLMGYVDLKTQVKNYTNELLT